MNGLSQNAVYLQNAKTKQLREECKKEIEERLVWYIFSSVNDLRQHTNLLNAIMETRKILDEMVIENRKTLNLKNDELAAQYNDDIL